MVGSSRALGTGLSAMMFALHLLRVDLRISNRRISSSGSDFVPGGNRNVGIESLEGVSQRPEYSQNVLSQSRILAVGDGNLWRGTRGRTASCMVGWAPLIKSQ